MISPSNKTTQSDMNITSLFNNDIHNNSNFILNLANNEFADNRMKNTFSQTIGKNQYFYYCYPDSWGDAVFNVGGFNGGISLIDTISFTNSSGNTTNFKIYRSDNQNLGTQSFIVK